MICLKFWTTEVFTFRVLAIILLDAGVAALFGVLVHPSAILMFARFIVLIYKASDFENHVRITRKKNYKKISLVVQQSVTHPSPNHKC